jgi:hypothetical protein
LSASASSHHSLSSAAFITNIAESDFRHAHPILRDVIAPKLEVIAAIPIAFRRAGFSTL